CASLRAARTRGDTARCAHPLAQFAKPGQAVRARGSKAEDLLQAVNTRCPADHPAGGADGAFRVDRPAGRPVDEFETLGGTGEDHVVIADRIAAAQRGETDIA